MSSRNTLRIGDVASSCGLSVDAVRYYERVGLLVAEGRTAGGFRTYNADAIERLTFVKQAQCLGLRLREIRELLGVPGDRGRQHCQRVRAVLVRRLDDVKSQMKELARFQRTLKRALANCDRALASVANVEECPVVRSLGASRARRSVPKR